MILPAGGRKSPAEAGREFCEQHVQRGPPLQTDNLAALRSERLLRGPSVPVRALRVGWECAAKQFTRSGQDGPAEMGGAKSIPLHVLGRHARNGTRPVLNSRSWS